MTRAVKSEKDLLENSTTEQLTLVVEAIEVTIRGCGEIDLRSIIIGLLLGIYFCDEDL